MDRPLVRYVPGAPAPEALVARHADEPWLLWLDTALPGGPWGRYSFLAIDPYRVLRGRGGRAEWVDGRGATPAASTPLTELRRELASRPRSRTSESVPFCGGAGGIFGYELGADLETVPPPATRDLPVPDMEVGFYDLVVGWDRLEDRCWIASAAIPVDGTGPRRGAAERLERAAAWLRGGAPPRDHCVSLDSTMAAGVGPPPPTFPVPGSDGLRSTFEPEGYRQAVRRAIEWIRAGDVYQVNLSQRFETEWTDDALALYLRLRRASPAPFGAYYAGRGFSVLSTSPERFLHGAAGGVVQARPIKGTRPRSEDPAEDARLAAELQSSDKERAENLMIVDLLRNDFSRVCRPESVRATDLFRVESYRTVHHLTSTVEGRLRAGHGAADLVAATYPCGSVTGAPKIRAMEIISELEPVFRGPYCGAIGYLGFGGDVDLSVSIRIAVAAAGRIVFHSGGGVVADSEPDAEYRETLDKARALLATISGP